MKSISYVVFSFPDFNSVTNNSHDPGDDSDYDSRSSSSNISTFSNQSWFIDEGQPVTETSESDECMTDDSDDSEDSIIESIKRCAKKCKTDGKGIIYLTLQISFIISRILYN